MENWIERTEEAIGIYGDIARQHDGVWLCRDTGVEYSDSDVRKMKSGPPSKPLSQKAKDARIVAKSFGSKALTGTSKQKDWAERIRAGFMAQMTPVQCGSLTDLSTAKFWIEVRAKSVKELVAMINGDRAAKVRIAEISRERNVILRSEGTTDEKGTIWYVKSDEGNRLRAVLSAETAELIKALIK